jgi:hypothetical protein
MLNTTYNVEISAAVANVRDARGTREHRAALETLAGLIRAAIAAETAGPTAVIAANFARDEAHRPGRRR